MKSISSTKLLSKACEQSRHDATDFRSILAEPVTER